MNAGDLRRLQALLERTVELAVRERLLPVQESGGTTTGTVAGQTAATVEDYVGARDLVRDLAQRFPSLPPSERDRLELNADLPQLAFHLAEELAAVDRAGTVDHEAFARSLTFLKRHLARLRAEHIEHVHTRLEPADLALATTLARLVRRIYEGRFASHYRRLGYRRPFVDKFYRDYALSGVPDGLLLRLGEIARRDAFDVVICVLKGGLPYTVLLELCGLPAGRIHYIICGRASGSHLEPSYIARPLDFEPVDLRGRSILVVDNNAATGATLSHLSELLHQAEPARMALFLDYILGDVASLSRPALEGLGFTKVCVGPYPPEHGQSRDVQSIKRHLLKAAERRLALGM